MPGTSSWHWTVHLNWLLPVNRSTSSILLSPTAGRMPSIKCNVTFVCIRRIRIYLKGFSNDGRCDSHTFLLWCHMISIAIRLILCNATTILGSFNGIGIWSYIHFYFTLLVIYIFHHLMNKYKYKRFRMETINPSVSISNLWFYTFTAIIIFFFWFLFLSGTNMEMIFPWWIWRVLVSWVHFFLYLRHPSRDSPISLDSELWVIHRHIIVK